MGPEDEHVQRGFCKLRHDEEQKLCTIKHKSLEDKVKANEDLVKEVCTKISGTNKLLFGLLVAVIVQLISKLV